MRSKNLQKNPVRSQSGASMLEYTLLAALISIVVILAVESVGRSAEATLNHVSTAMGQTNYTDTETTSH